MEFIFISVNLKRSSREDVKNDAGYAEKLQVTCLTTIKKLLIYNGCVCAHTNFTVFIFEFPDES